MNFNTTTTDLWIDLDQNIKSFQAPLSTKVSAPRWKRNQQSSADRIIADRSNWDISVSQHQLERGNHAIKGKNTSNDSSIVSNDLSESYSQEVASMVVGPNVSSDFQILSLKEKPPTPVSGYRNSMKVLYSQSASHAASKKQITQGHRELENKSSMTNKNLLSSLAKHIPSAPERMLDCPDIIDDYYLNTIDWSQKNIVAVALGKTVYLWNSISGSIQELTTTSGLNSYVASVKWSADGSYLSVGVGGSDENPVQVWDVASCRKVRNMKGHTGRVSCQSWNNHILSTSGSDSTIIHHDVRIANHITMKLANYHNGEEICGLAWSPDGTQLASGGNDNIVNIWDAGRELRGPRFSLSDHTAAVKAMDWCPWQPHTLATGGGTTDRNIRLWNTRTGQCTRSVDTFSQVTGLKWSKHSRQLVSSHGFQNNQLCVWQAPTLEKITELQGHSRRVLNLSLSPDGTRVCSASADETIRFWSVFPKSFTSKAKESCQSENKSPVCRIR